MLGSLESRNLLPMRDFEGSCNSNCARRFSLTCHFFRQANPRVLGARCAPVCGEYFGVNTLACPHNTWPFVFEVSVVCQQKYRVGRGPSLRTPENNNNKKSVLPFDPDCCCRYSRVVFLALPSSSTNTPLVAPVRVLRLNSSPPPPKSDPGDPLLLALCRLLSFFLIQACG